MADSLLVLMRSNRKGDRQMNERLAMPHVERIAIFGQEVLVDVTPDAATVPEETIEAIVDWLAARAGVGPTMLIDPDAIGRSRATVGTTPAGVAVDEWPVSLGPLGLFGIVTSQREADGGVITPDASPATGDASDIRSDVPTIFFFNAGVIDHVGPARLWVQLSRLWAEAGFRAVRFDLSGIGDSPVRVGQPGQIVYPPEALNDIRDVLRDVLPDDPSNAVLVGLCSGAYHAIEGALAYKVRGLCAVNPFFIFTRPKESALNTREQPSGAMKGWTRALFAHDQLASIVQRLPGAAWWIINRIALESPPTNTLSRVIDTGVNVFMIAGKNEAIQLSRGERWAVRRLRRTGRFRLEVVPDLEHTLFEQHGRVLATELLTEHVLSRYGTSVPRD
jgi:pimeloyl-ACP methyl ester carboxylesterase